MGYKCKNLRNFFPFFAILLLSNTNCNSQIRAINLISNFQIARIQDGRVFDLNDTTKIVYYENFILFEIPYVNQVSNVNMDSNGNVISENLVKTELKHKFYIYAKGAEYGLDFDSLNASVSEKFSVDSLLKAHAFKDFEFSNNNDSLIKTFTYGNILAEEFVPKVKWDSSYPDSSYLFYSDKLNVDFSFSKKLDSIHKAKLFKIRFIYNAIAKDDYPAGIPKREFLFELQETPVSHSNELIELFETFKKTQSTSGIKSHYQ